MKTKKIISAIIMAFLFVSVVPIALPQTVITAEAASIKLNTTSATLYTTETVQLVIRGTTKKVTWSSSEKSVATVNSNGNVTGKKSGSATISAKVGGNTYKCKITVKAPEISTEELLMNTGNTYVLKLRGTKEPVTWSTSDTAVATVERGIVKAVGKGDCTITAVYKGSSNKYSCVIHVNDWLSCDVESINMKVGESKRIMITYGMTWLDVPFKFGETNNNQDSDGGLDVKWDENWTSIHSEEDFDAKWQYGITVTALTTGESKLIIFVEAGEPYNGRCEYVTIPVTITK